MSSWKFNPFTGTLDEVIDATNVPHNDTTGKQGGTPGEYYHLTAAQHAGKIISSPLSGQYKITGLRLDSNKHIVITYDETPEP